MGTHDGPAAVTKVADRVLTSLDRPFLIGDEELFVQASVGIAIFPRDGATVYLDNVGDLPAFDALLAQVSGNFPRFYEEVKRLAALPRERREDALRGMLAQR